MRVLSAVAILLAFVPTARAECLDETALDAGIRLTGPELSLTTQRQADGTIQSELLSAEEGGVRMIYDRGPYMTAMTPILPDGSEAGRAIEVDFEGGVESLPDPAPGATWSGEVTSGFPGDAALQLITLTWEAGEPVEIGGCAYDSLWMITRSPQEGGEEERHRYLPALRLLLVEIDPEVEGLSISGM